MDLLNLLGSMLFNADGGGGGTPPADPPADPPAEGDKGEGDGGGDSLLGGEANKGTKGEGAGDEGEGDGGPEGNAAKGAPETYDTFEIPEGMVVSEERLTEFASAAREANMTQEQAQAVINYRAKEAEAEVQAWSQQCQEWQKELAKDKEFGGAKFAGNTSAARSFIDRMAHSPDDAKAIKDFFNMGHGNFPPLYRLMVRAARAIGEDSVGGHRGAAQKSSEEREAERLARRYPKMAEQLNKQAAGDK